MRIQRTHDAFYLDENRYEEPKEMFKFILKNMLMSQPKLNKMSICDFGCAAGEFLYYLEKELPEAELHGVDLLPNLIAKCSKHVPSAKLKVGSVLDASCESNDSYDVSLLIGVHSIFDNFEDCFTNIINWTKPGGKVYIAGMFNPFPLDVFIKYKGSNAPENTAYESGWNIFSQESVSLYLQNNRKVKSFTFKKFDIEKDLQRQDDPVRSWTLKDARNSRFIVNGLCLLQPHYLLDIYL
jgi:SAM-dependent methyltransferase